MLDVSDDSIKEEEIETIETDFTSSIIESDHSTNKAEEMMTSPEVIVDHSDPFPVQEILNGNPLLKEENAEQVIFSES
jgi:hypothetical protein